MRGPGLKRHLVALQLQENASIEPSNIGNSTKPVTSTESIQIPTLSSNVTMLDFVTKFYTSPTLL